MVKILDYVWVAFAWVLEKVMVFAMPDNEREAYLEYTNKHSGSVA